MAKQSDGHLMTLMITKCSAVYHGLNQKGDDYTIYEVEAKKTNGEPVNEKLRSFFQLPVGIEVEVYAKPYDSKKHGRSWTLSPKNPPKGQQAGGGLSQELASMKEYINGLLERVGALEGHVMALRGMSSPASAESSDPFTPAPVQAESPGSQFGDEPPF
jgi:hypothetical protein